jgi:hypothetical protein
MFKILVFSSLCVSPAKDVQMVAVLVLPMVGNLNSLKVADIQ